MHIQKNSEVRKVLGDNAPPNNSMEMRQKQRRCFSCRLACVFAHIVSAVRWLHLADKDYSKDGNL